VPRLVERGIERDGLPKLLNRVAQVAARRERHAKIVVK